MHLCGPLQYSGGLTPCARLHPFIAATFRQPVLCGAGTIVDRALIVAVVNCSVPPHPKMHAASLSFHRCMFVILAES